MSLCVDWGTAASSTRVSRRSNSVTPLRLPSHSRWIGTVKGRDGRDEDDTYEVGGTGRVLGVPESTGARGHTTDEIGWFSSCSFP